MVPEGAVDGHPVYERGQSLGASTVMGFATPMPVAHKPGALEYDQMLGNGRLRDAGATGQRMNCLFAVTREPFKKRPSRGVGEGFEDVIGQDRHEQSITKWLLVVKPLESLFWDARLDKR